MSDDECDEAEPAGDEETATAEAEGRTMAPGGADPAAGEVTVGSDHDDMATPGIRARIRGQLSAGTRSTLSAYGWLVIVACLLVAAGGGYLTYTAMAAPTVEMETVTEAEWTTESEFVHGVTIREGTAVFRYGEQLRDRPVYFARLSPELEGRYVVSHTGDVDSASGTVELQLVIQATETRNGEEIVHWRETDQLGSTEVSNLTAGDETTVPFVVDTTNLTLRVEDIKDELGASPGTTEIRVVADAVIETEAAGERLIDERNDELVVDLNTDVTRTEEENGSTVIEVSGGTYSIDERVAEPNTQPVTTTVTVPVQQSPTEVYSGPALVGLGLLGAGTVWLFSAIGVFAVSAAERQRLSFSRARADYDEWISRGEPPEEEPRRRIRLESLEDLVNVAIDSNRRVIEQPAPVRYAVWIDDIEYVFDPPPALQGRIKTDVDSGVSVRTDDPISPKTPTPDAHESTTDIPCVGDHGDSDSTSTSNPDSDSTSTSNPDSDSTSTSNPDSW